MKATVIVEDWPTREAFETWWLANVRELNRMAVNPPPRITSVDIVVLNDDWHRIADWIDRWKTRHGL